jgi:nucleotide-binding universal stress UspA family protein
MIGKKIQKILVALDGSKNSERGLEMAIAFARYHDTKLTGIHVISKIPKEFQKLEYPEKPLLIEAEKIMEHARVLSAQNGILFEEKITFGYIGDEIVKFAAKIHYDIIIIGARGRGAIKEILLGSVSNYVLHQSKIPVMIVK